jgi:hypothetical protein
MLKVRLIALALMTKSLKYLEKIEDYLDGCTVRAEIQIEIHKKEKRDLEI